MEKTRVLYVEDEPFLARIVKESLESRGYDVRLVGDGGMAGEAFAEYRPDICVLDVMLPQKDGFTIAREIRSAEPGLPIIFLTAKTQVEDVLKGFDSGGNDYLRKPFSMEELIVRIQNLLQFAASARGKAKAGDVRTLGSYIFQPQNYTLERDGTVKKLSHRENMILQLLTENTGKPVLRKDILLKVWGDDSYYNSRNLDVYIARIREYFNGDPAVAIVTIKGVGYHFIVKQ
jgi:DNA-binding response OmpR family regulator